MAIVKHEKNRLYEQRQAPKRPPSPGRKLDVQAVAGRRPGGLTREAQHGVTIAGPPVVAWLSVRIHTRNSVRTRPILGAPAAEIGDQGVVVTKGRRSRLQMICITLRPDRAAVGTPPPGSTH